MTEQLPLTLDAAANGGALGRGVHIRVVAPYFQFHGYEGQVIGSSPIRFGPLEGDYWTVKLDGWTGPLPILRAKEMAVMAVER